MSETKTKLQWLWENMKGSRGIYIAGMLGTIVYNILQLTVPYYSGKIVDLFLSGADARENLRTNSNLFYHLLICMVGFTVLRGVIVYVDCMVYEHVSQTVLYRVRNFLYDKIQRQDGRITEAGSHEELLAKKGCYYELMQKKGYYYRLYMAQLDDALAV